MNHVKNTAEEENMNGGTFGEKTEPTGEHNPRGGTSSTPERMKPLDTTEGP